MKTPKSVAINKAAKMKGCSRQAIHAAIAAGRLECVEILKPIKEVTVSSLAKFSINPHMKRTGRKSSR